MLAVPAPLIGPGATTLDLRDATGTTRITYDGFEFERVRTNNSTSSNRVYGLTL